MLRRNVRTPEWKPGTTSQIGRDRVNRRCVLGGPLLDRVRFALSYCPSQTAREAKRRLNRPPPRFSRVIALPLTLLLCYDRDIATFDVVLGDAC